MKAIVKVRPEVGGWELQELPIPEIKSDELLVKVEATGICGSDRDVYDWAEPKQGLPLPFTMGHEFFGEVVAVGDNVKGYAVGDKIASDSHIPCGECYLCRTGKRHLCMVHGILGHHVNGCFAEYIALPAVAAFKMPQDTKPEEGALMEPMGVVYHAVTRAEVSGKSVLVMGLGALGYIMVDAVRNMGASRVIVCSTNDAKREKMLAEGADFAINSKKEDVVAKVMEYTNGHGADVIFEMTGVQRLYDLSIDSAAYGGAMVCVGVPTETVQMGQYFNRVMAKELVITGSFGRLFYETWELMRDLMEMKKIVPSKYVGKLYPLEEFEQALQDARSTMGRVILIP